MCRNFVAILIYPKYKSVTASYRTFSLDKIPNRNLPTAVPVCRQGQHWGGATPPPHPSVATPLVPSTDNWTLNRNQYSHLLPNHPNEVFSKEWPASGLWQDDKLWIVRKKNASRSLSIILYYTRDYTVGRCATNSEVSARPPSHPFSLLLHHV